MPTVPGVQVASLESAAQFVRSALPWAPSPTLARVPPTWCRNTCCCSCCTAASPRAVRGESVRAGDLAPPACRPWRPFGGPSTLVEDSMSLSSSFREVMMGMLHTGWKESFLSWVTHSKQSFFSRSSVCQAFPRSCQSPSAMATPCLLRHQIETGGPWQEKLPTGKQIPISRNLNSRYLGI